MPCPFCIAIFEQADAAYLNHVLAGHPRASLIAGAVLTVSAIAYRSDARMILVSGLGVLAAAYAFRSATNP
jgi:hypothetical protein